MKHIRLFVLLGLLIGLMGLAVACAPACPPPPPGYLRILQPVYRNVGRAEDDRLPPGTATPPTGGAVAFDGIDTLYYTVDDRTSIIMKIKTNGTGEEEVAVFHWMGGFEDSVLALAYDSIRDGLWIGGRGSTAGGYSPCEFPTGGIWFLDLSPPGGGVSLSQKWSVTGFTNYDDSRTGHPCVIGALEHDPSTDTLWISELYSSRVYQATPNGEEVSFFDIAPRENRGIAHDDETLWLGFPNPGDSSVIDQYSTTGIATGTSLEPLTLRGFGTDDEWYPFGMAFDSYTFSPKCAIWVNPSGSRTVQGVEKFRTEIVAFEIPCREGMDGDADGIADQIDADPGVFSNQFGDGVTGGTITDRGDQILAITDEPDPAGVRISADPSGGAAPATVSVCNGAVTLTFSAGEEVVVTCG